MMKFEIIENPMRPAIRKRIMIYIGVPEESRAAMKHSAKENGVAQVIFGEKQVEYISKTEICIE